MVLRLLYATKTKKLHGKLDRLGKDCFSGRNKDLVVSCTTLTEMQLKPRKARCCQSERFTSATYGTFTWARQQLLEKLDSPIFLN